MSSTIDINHARTKAFEVAQPKIDRAEFRGIPDYRVWLDHPVQAALGDCLRASFEPIVWDTIPPPLLKLLEVLDLT